MMPKSALFSLFIPIFVHKLPCSGYYTKIRKKLNKGTVQLVFSCPHPFM